MPWTLKMLSLLVFAASGQAFAQETSRPESRAPLLTYDVPQIERIIRKPDSFTPGMVEFEWVDKEPEPQNQQQESENQTPSLEAQQKIANSDNNPFDFRTPEPPKEVLNPNTKIEEKEEESHPDDSGPHLIIENNIVPDVFWVENSSGNPKEFTINIPKMSRKTTLVLGSNGMVNWNIRAENGNALQSVLLYGPLALNQNIRVTSKTPTQPEIIRRNDLGINNHRNGLKGRPETQPTAIISKNHTQITLVP
mgnify:CR=1 FL=1